MDNNFFFEYDPKLLGKLIHDLRKEQGDTQETLSSKAKLGRTHLTTIEAGKKQIRLDTLWKLAEALDEPPSEILSMYEHIISTRHLK